jgi:uncharacterized protein YcbK (DUF882 family)
MLLKFKKDEVIQITDHFTTKEFACPCTSCVENFIEKDLVEKLEEIRTATGPLRITSGYRCPEHNKAVGGEPNSAHQSGLAADVQPIPINVDDLDKLYDACFDKFDNIGDGRRLRFVHVDVRSKKPDGKKRTWSY